MAARDIQAGRAHVLIALRDRVSAGLKRVQHKFRKFGASMSTAGASLAVGVGAPLVRIMQIFSGFDSSMARVGAVTNATAGQMATLRAEAKNLGATTRFTAAQSAEAMAFLGMAGFNTTQILAGIGPVLNVASAGMLDLGRAADIVSDATTAFGMAAEQTTRVADVMAKTATSSNTTIEQMGEAFTYAAAQGRAAGQTIENVSAAIGVLGNAGLKASLAGSGIQGIFKRLVKGDAIAKLRSMGVAFADSAGNIRPLAALMTDLQRATAGMTQLKRLQTFEGLFGLHAKSALILSANAEALRNLTGELYNSTGAAGTMAAKMQDSVLGQWLGFSSAFESITNALGEAFKGPTKSVLAFGATALRSISGFIDKNQSLFRVIGIVAGVLAGVGALMATLGVASLAVSFVIGGLATAWGFVTAALSALAGPLGIALVAIAALGVAAWTFRAQIATAFTAVAEYFRPLTDALGRVWAIFSETFSGIVSALLSGKLSTAAAIAWLGFVAAAWQGVAEFGGAISTAIGFLQAWIPGMDGVRNYVTKSFASIGKSILAGRWDLAAAIAMTKLKLAIAIGWGKVTNVWAAAMTGLGTMWDFAVWGLRSTWNLVVAAVYAGVLSITTIFTWLLDQLDKLWTGFRVAVTKFQTLLGSDTAQQAGERIRDEQVARSEARGKKRKQRFQDLEKFHQKRQQKTNDSLAASAGGRVTAEQRVNRGNQENQRRLRQEIADLERQASKAHADAGSPTIASTAAEARKRLDQAVAEAKSKAGKDDAGEDGDAGGDTSKTQIKAQIGAAGKQVKKITSAGTFSAAAANQQLGFDQKPGQETAKNTRKMVRIMLNQHPQALFR